MKILIVTERYSPEVGAAPSRLTNMAQGLHKSGCEVDVLTNLPYYPKGRIFKGYRHRLFKKEQIDGITIFRLWIFATIARHPILRVLNMFSFALMLWLFAFRVRRIKRYDRVIIQTPTLVSAASAMLLFKGLYGKCCVLNVSDLWPSTAVDLGAMHEGSRSHRFLAALERYLYRRADAILGQSNEILEHIKTFHPDKPLFLYRNLQPGYTTATAKRKNEPLKVVFSGMLGVAQNVLGLVENIPFAEMGAEFHIVGGGKQLKPIEAYIAAHPDCKIFTHGFVKKEEVAAALQPMDVAVVPLAQRIRGAVPSKIYDILPQGIPILFCGGGEGATFIADRHVGLTSEPNDYAALTENIRKMVALTSDDYTALSQHCLDVSRAELDFQKQMDCTFDLLKGLSKIKKPKKE